MVPRRLRTRARRTSRQPATWRRSVRTVVHTWRMGLGPTAAPTATSSSSFRRCLLAGSSVRVAPVSGSFVSSPRLRYVYRASASLARISGASPLAGRPRPCRLPSPSSKLDLLRGRESVGPQGATGAVGSAPQPPRPGSMVCLAGRLAMSVFREFVVRVQTKRSQFIYHGITLLPDACSSSRSSLTPTRRCRPRRRHWHRPWRRRQLELRRRLRQPRRHSHRHRRCSWQNEQPPQQPFAVLSPCSSARRKRRHRHRRSQRVVCPHTPASRSWTSLLHTPCSVQHGWHS